MESFIEKLFTSGTDDVADEVYNEFQIDHFRERFTIYTFDVNYI